MRAEPRSLVLGLLLAQCLCAPAFATLGEDAATVEADRAQMKAQIRTTAIAGYTVHEIQTDTNTTVREYIAPSGKVFAVAWDGPLLPDFAQTFGRYYEQYQQATTAPHVGRRTLAIEGSDFVVRSSGHLRAFRGMAWVPSLLPTNFSPADIK